VRRGEEGRKVLHYVVLVGERKDVRRGRALGPSLRGFGGGAEVDFEGFVDEFGYGGFLVGEHGGEGDVPFEVTDLDDHFVAFFVH
jgi:hypothetical protein